MFAVMFDGNAIVCETRDEAVNIVDNLTTAGYNYITISENKPIDYDDLEHIEI